jgi:hypothetical protein
LLSKPNLTILLEDEENPLPTTSNHCTNRL